MDCSEAISTPGVDVYFECQDYLFTCSKSIEVSLGEQHLYTGSTRLNKKEGKRGNKSLCAYSSLVGYGEKESGVEVWRRDSRERNPQFLDAKPQINKRFMEEQPYSVQRIALCEGTVPVEYFKVK